MSVWGSPVTLGGRQSSPTLVSKTITENGVYDPANDHADGYSQVVVSVQEATALGLFTLNQENVTEAEGQLVISNHRAYLSAKLYLTTANGNTMQRMLTVANSIKPCGVHRFMAGNGATNYVHDGRIDPNGDLYCYKVSNVRYVFLNAEWEIPISVVPIAYESDHVTEILGDICVVNDFAYVSLVATLTASSSGWVNVFTIPQNIRPSQTVRFFAQYDNLWNSQKNASVTYATRDTDYDVTTGVVSIWLPSGTKMYTIKACWKIAT